MTIRNEGMRDRQLEKRRKDNPYKRGTWQHSEWDQGWCQADQELRREQDFSPGL